MPFAACHQIFMNQMQHDNRSVASDAIIQHNESIIQSIKQSSNQSINSRTNFRSVDRVDRDMSTMNDIIDESTLSHGRFEEAKMKGDLELNKNPHNIFAYRDNIESLLFTDNNTPLNDQMHNHMLNRARYASLPPSRSSTPSSYQSNNESMNQSSNSPFDCQSQFYTSIETNSQTFQLKPSFSFSAQSSPVGMASPLDRSAASSPALDTKKERAATFAKINSSPNRDMQYKAYHQSFNSSSSPFSANFVHSHPSIAATTPTSALTSPISSVAYSTSSTANPLDEEPESPVLSQIARSNLSTPSSDSSVDTSRDSSRIHSRQSSLNRSFNQSFNTSFNSRFPLSTSSFSFAAPAPITQSLNMLPWLNEAAAIVCDRPPKPTNLPAASVLHDLLDVVLKQSGADEVKVCRYSETEQKWQVSVTRHSPEYQPVAPRTPDPHEHLYDSAHQTDLPVTIFDTISQTKAFASYTREEVMQRRELRSDAYFTAFHSIPASILSIPILNQSCNQSVQAILLLTSSHSQTTFDSHVSGFLQLLGVVMLPMLAPLDNNSSSSNSSRPSFNQAHYESVIESQNRQIADLSSETASLRLKLQLSTSQHRQIPSSRRFTREPFTVATALPSSASATINQASPAQSPVISQSANQSLRQSISQQSPVTNTVTSQSPSPSPSSSSIPVIADDNAQQVALHAPPPVKRSLYEGWAKQQTDPLDIQHARKPSLNPRFNRFTDPMTSHLPYTPSDVALSPGLPVPTHRRAASTGPPFSLSVSSITPTADSRTPVVRRMNEEALVNDGYRPPKASNNPFLRNPRHNTMDASMTDMFSNIERSHHSSNPFLSRPMQTQTPNSSPQRSPFMYPTHHQNISESSPSGSPLSGSPHQPHTI